MSRQKYIESPCNSICTMDAKSGYCLGCWRTAEEIANWRAANNNWKSALLKKLNARREMNGGRPRRLTARKRRS